MRTYKLYLFCRQGLVNIVPLPGLYQTLRRKAQFGCAVTGENSKGSYSGAPLLLRVLYDYCWVILNFFKVCISPQLLKTSLCRTACGKSILFASILQTSSKFLSR